MSGFLSGLFGDSLSGGNHQDPSTRFTRLIDTKLDPMYWLTGGNKGFVGKAKNKLFDLTDRAADEGNRAFSSVLTPVDKAIAPADPLYHTGFGQNLHQWVDNKPGSTFGAIMGGEALAGLGGGAGAASGGSAGGIGAGGLGAADGGALGATAPAAGFGEPAGAGIQTFGYADNPSIGSPTAVGGFNWQKLGSNFLKNQGQSKSSQGAPKTYHSQLLNDYQPFVSTPQDFNPMANQGLDSNNLKMLIAALRNGNGGQ